MLAQLFEDSNLCARRSSRFFNRHARRRMRGRPRLRLDGSRTT